MQSYVGRRCSVRAWNTGFETMFGTLSEVSAGRKVVHTCTGVLFAVLRKSVACARVLLLQERNRSESDVSIFSFVLKCYKLVSYKMYVVREDHSCTIVAGFGEMLAAAQKTAN